MQPTIRKKTSQQQQEVEFTLAKAIEKANSIKSKEGAAAVNDFINTVSLSDGTAKELRDVVFGTKDSELIDESVLGVARREYKNIIKALLNEDKFDDAFDELDAELEKTKQPVSSAGLSRGSLYRQRYYGRY